MPLKDAQNEARGTRRKQKRGQLCLDPNKPKGAHQNGAGKEDQPFRTGGENWARNDSGCRARGTTTGGILRQLIEEVDDQLAYHELQIKKLKQKHEQLLKMYEEQQQTTGEGKVESESAEQLKDQE